MPMPGRMPMSGRPMRPSGRSRMGSPMSPSPSPMTGPMSSGPGPQQSRDQQILRRIAMQQMRPRKPGRGGGMGGGY